MSQCFVHGDSLKSYLVGVVVPDPEVVIPAVVSMPIPGLVDRSMEELCKQPAVKKLIIDDMRDVGRRAGLLNFQQVSFNSDEAPSIS